MEDNIGLMIELTYANASILLVGGLAVVLVLFVADLVFGPSDVILEVQRRLYEADKEEARRHFDEEVQAEMKRIRKSST